jgi:hypothetical protein
MPSVLQLVSVILLIYGVPFQNSEERNRWLPSYLLTYYPVSGSTQAPAACHLSGASTSCSPDQCDDAQQVECQLVYYILK